MNVSKKKWLIEMWHNVDEDISHGYQTITPLEAEEHVKYICKQRDKRKLWVASFVEAIKYILEVQTSNVFVYKINKNMWKVSLNTSISQIDSSFDMPLTIKIFLSENYENIVVRRKGNVKKYSKMRDIDSELVFMIEIFPGESVFVVAN